MENQDAPELQLATAYKAIVARHDQIITEISNSGKAA